MRDLKKFASDVFWGAIYGLLLAAFVSLLLFWTKPASADTVIGVHLVSHHYPQTVDQGNKNYGLYVRGQDWTAGVYQNSIERTSVYAGLSLHAPLGISIDVGVVTGYQLKKDRHGWERGYSHGYLTPMVSPSIALPALLGVVPRVAIIPGIGLSSTAVHLSVEHAF